MSRSFIQMGKWATFRKSGKPTKSGEKQLLREPLDYSRIPYTPRQSSILNGEIELVEIRLTEVAAIKRKAEARCDSEEYGRACEIYEARKHIDSYKPMHSVEESKEILQCLSKHKIDWDKY